MTVYNNLPVYKVSYDLLAGLFRLVEHFSREYKFTLGEQIKKETIELITNIYRANRSTEKKPLIQAGRENVEVVRLYVRLTHDLKQVNLKNFIAINEKIESISKQLTAWQKACS